MADHRKCSLPSNGSVNIFHTAQAHDIEGGYLQENSRSNAKSHIRRINIQSTFSVITKYCKEYCTDRITTNTTEFYGQANNFVRKKL
jgi:hypothetical protein